MGLDVKIEDGDFHFCNLKFPKPENQKFISSTSKDSSKKWSHDGAAYPDCETLCYALFPLCIMPIKNVSAKICSVIVTLRNTQKGRKCLVNYYLIIPKLQRLALFCPPALNNF